MPSSAPKTNASPNDSTRRRVLWIGSVDGLELGMARSGLAALADVTDADSPQAAVAAASIIAEKTTPALAVLASDRPARFTAADALLLSRAWPLMPIVSVASSLVDGRRRSGRFCPESRRCPGTIYPGGAAGG